MHNSVVDIVDGGGVVAGEPVDILHLALEVPVDIPQPVAAVDIQYLVLVVPEAVPV